MLLGALDQDGAGFERLEVGCLLLGDAGENLDLGEPVSDAARLALCGGLALYLLGNVAFRLRMIGAVSYAKLAGAAGLLAVFALGGGLSALWVMGLATLVLAALCALETLEPA